MQLTIQCDRPIKSLQIEFEGEGESVSVSATPQDNISSSSPLPKTSPVKEEPVVDPREARLDSADIQEVKKVERRLPSEDLPDISERPPQVDDEFSKGNY